MICVLFFYFFFHAENDRCQSVSHDMENSDSENCGFNLRTCTEYTNPPGPHVFAVYEIKGTHDSILSDPQSIPTWRIWLLIRRPIQFDRYHRSISLSMPFQTQYGLRYSTEKCAPAGEHRLLICKCSLISVQIHIQSKSTQPKEYCH